MSAPTQVAPSAKTTADKLKQRGILKASQFLNCQIAGHILKIPLQDLDGKTIGWRAKDFAPQPRKKYFWLPSKPDHEFADWVLLPGLKDAIAANDGVCYLANGEMALFALFASTVYHSICTTLSEISVPKNTISVLERLEVRELRYLIDKDEAGLQGAINWRDALLGSDISFNAYKMPEHLCDKADANDLWIDCEFDSAKMKQALDTLERAILPQPEVKPVYDGDYDFDKTPQGLIDVLTARMGFSGRWKNDGWSRKNISSPFREDNDPSFGFNRQSGVGHDFGTGESYSAITLAKHFNIDWKQYYPQIEADSEYKRRKALYDALPESEKFKRDEYLYDSPALPGGGHYVSMPKDLYEIEAYPGGYHSWIEQEHLPLSWISGILLLTDGRSAVMRVMMEMHRAFRIGKLDPQCFTKKDIISVLNLPRKSTEAALESLLQMNFVSFLGTIYTIYIDTSIEINSTQKSKGRPPQQYCINTDSDSIRLLLLQMVQRYIIEHYAKKTLSPRLLHLREELELSHDEWSEWFERIESAVDPLTQVTIDKEISEYRRALWSDTFYPIDLDSVKSSKDIRVQMLVQFLSQPGRENGIQISDDRLARFLGCTSGNLQAIFQAAHVTTDSRHRHYEVDSPHQCSLDIEISKAQKEYQGAATAILYKRISTGKWSGKIFGHDAMLQAFYRERSNMARLIIHVEQPSLKRFKSQEELYKEYGYDPRYILYENPLEIEPSPDVLLYDSPAGPEPEKPEPKKSNQSPPQRTKPDRNWLEHRQDWLFEQLQLEVHLFTDSQLLAGGCLIDKDGHVIRPQSGIDDIVLYLNRHGNKETVRICQHCEKHETHCQCNYRNIVEVERYKPLCTIASFYGDDENVGEETLIGELEILGGVIRDDKPERVVEKVHNLKIDRNRVKEPPTWYKPDPAHAKFAKLMKEVRERISA